MRLPSGCEPWRRARTPDGAEAPLRAGVSSFGLGGVNAHVVVEEYREEPVADLGGEQLFVLSAKDGQRLRSYARRLATWARGHEKVSPAALAHTLRTGRAEYTERLAVVADSLPALADALETWGDGGTAPGVFTGDGRDDTTALLLDGPEGRRYLASVVEAGRWDKLARLWVGGAPIEWARLWPQAAPRRIPAPTYPFARESYWLTPGKRFDTAQAEDTGLTADALTDTEAHTGVSTAVDADPHTPDRPHPAPPAVPDTRPRSGTSASPRPAEPAPAGPPEGDADPESALRAHVRQLLAAHLGMSPERLPVDRVLSDAGVDSLGLRRLGRRLGADYAVRVPTRMFTVAQTVRSLTRAVFEAYGPLPAPAGPGRETGPDGAPPSPAPDPKAAPDRAAPEPDDVGSLLAGLRDGTVGVDDALAMLRTGAGE